MHTRFALPAALGAVLLLSACAPSTGTTPEGTASSSAMGMQASSAMTMGNASSDAAMMNNLNVGVQFGTAESQPAMQGQRIIDMDVSNFAFSPSTVHLKKGEKVAIRLHGKEGKHGFGSADLGINVTVDAGQTVVSIPTDKAGTFAFRCTVPCGPGHMNMQGSIVIE